MLILEHVSAKKGKPCNRFSTKKLKISCGKKKKSVAKSASPNPAITQQGSDARMFVVV